MARYIDPDAGLAGQASRNPREGGGHSGIDVLLRWRMYPGLLHLFFYAMLAVIVYFAFAPQHSEENIATALVWKLWWPALPFLILLGGRIWCGVCPFGGAADAAGRLRKNQPHAPRVIRSAGPWLGLASVFLFGLSFLSFGLEANARATGLILILMTTAAFGLSLLWRGRSFCRYLCPVGLITRVYSFFSMIRVSGSGIGHAGGKRCPAGQAPAALRQPSQCQLCGGCLKCDGPGGVTTSFSLGSPRQPASKEFGAIEAGISLLLMGLMAADSVRMTSLFARFQQAMLPFFGFNYRLTVVAGVTGLAAAVAGLAVLVLFIAKPGRRLLTLTGASFTVLPLTLGVFLSLAVQHLWSGGWPALQTMLVEFRLVSWSGHMPPTNVYLFSWPLKLMQLGLLGTGLMLSLSLAGKRLPGKDSATTSASSGRTAWMHRAVILASAAGFGFLFILPMSGAC